MKQLLCCIVLCIVLLLSSSSQSICQNQSETGTDSYWKILSEVPIADLPGLLRVGFWNGTEGIGIQGSSIMSTDDGGRTWKSKKEFREYGISDMAFDKNGSVWIAGSFKSERPALLHSSDFGNSWAEVPIKDISDKKDNKRFERFFAVCTGNDGTLWAGGDGGIFNLVPKGSILEIRSFEKTANAIYDIACSEKDVWAVGKNGLILRNGKSWDRTANYHSSSFYRVIENENGLWILGADWQNDNHPPPVGILLFKGKQSVKLKSVTPKKAKPLYDIAFVGNEGWLVGNGGSIYSSNDKGMTWTEQKSPTKNHLDSVFILDEKNRWIVGEQATVLRWNK